MKQHLRRFWNRLAEDIEFYLTLVAATVVLMLERLHIVHEEIVLSSILAVLVIVAFSIVRNRRSIEEMIKHTTMPQTANLAVDDSFFKERLATAREVSMLVVANPDVVIPNFVDLLDLVNRGGKVRYCIINPNGNALKMATARDFYSSLGSNEQEGFDETTLPPASGTVGEESNSGGPTNLQASTPDMGRPTSTIAINPGSLDPAGEHLRRDVITCLQTMQFLRERTTAGLVEIRIVDILPSAVITMVDPDIGAAVLFVTVPGFRQRYVDSPSFLYYRRRERERFEFYQTTFEKIWTWEGCRPFDPVTDLLSPAT
jgi:hypothetical protein